MKADKPPIIPYDSSILTDGPACRASKQHKPFPDISKQKNLVGQKFEILEIYLSLSDFCP